MIPNSPNLGFSFVIGNVYKIIFILFSKFKRSRILHLPYEQFLQFLFLVTKKISYFTKLFHSKNISQRKYI